MLIVSTHAVSVWSWCPRFIILMLHRERKDQAESRAFSYNTSTCMLTDQGHRVALGYVEVYNTKAGGTHATYSVTSMAAAS